jgi:type VI protein secretion system component Hcp
MAENQSDILMKLVPVGSNQGLAADAKSRVLRDDRLLLGFTEGRFFEIDEFDFGLALNDFENAGSGNPDPAIASGKFASWRDSRKDVSTLKDIHFPVEMQEFSFTRLIDRASPVIFHNCANSVGYASASVVKRKPTGQAVAVQGFLRLDFKDVLITSIKFVGGDLQKETCSFICRGLNLQYRSQNADGSLSASEFANWDQKMALRGQGG